MAETNHKLAEVLVSGAKHALIAMRLLQDFIVADAGTNVRRLDDVEPLSAQPFNNGSCDAFVSEQAHNHSAANTDSCAR